MTAGWLAASVISLWVSGDVLAPRALLSISLLLLSLSVLWLSVSAAAVVGLAAGLFSVLMGSAALEQAMFLVLMAGICAYFSRPQVRWGFVWLASIWSAWYSSYMYEVSGRIFVFGSMAVLLTGAYALGTGARKLREKQEQNKRELEAAERRHRESLAAERRSLARDLHDVVAHDITVIAMQAEMARLGQDDELVRKTLGRVGKSSRAALEDLRRIVTVLTEEDSEYEDDTAGDHRLTVEEGLKKFSLELESLGIRTETALSGRWDDVAPSLERSAYRILQECCTNVIKYGARGPGATCTLSAERTAQGIDLYVANSLPAQERSREDSPFSAEDGLRNIQKRASEFGGRVEAGVSSSGTWETRVLNLRKT